jgi:hypothetical protein
MAFLRLPQMGRGGKNLGLDIRLMAGYEAFVILAMTVLQDLSKSFVVLNNVFFNEIKTINRV